VRVWAHEGQRVVCDGVQMKPLPSICIIGAILVDSVAYLSNAETTDVRLSLDSWFQGSVEYRVGGTAIHTAQAAKEVGCSSVRVIGIVGSGAPRSSADIWGTMVGDLLAELDVHFEFAVSNQLATGATVTLYVKDGQRVMVADRGANALLSVSDITEAMREYVRSSNVLYVSGYMLLESCSALAVMELVGDAHSHGVLTVLDVVPHRLYTCISSEQFGEYKRYIDILVGGTRTLQRLTGVSEDLSGSALDVTRTLASKLLRSHSGTLLYPNVETFYVRDNVGFEAVVATDYGKAALQAKRGYLDRQVLPHLIAMSERFGLPVARSLDLPEDGSAK
jgi:sugar/nucleoside kinase (ribokinase family)